MREACDTRIFGQEEIARTVGKFWFRPWEGCFKTSAPQIFTIFEHFKNSMDGYLIWDVEGEIKLANRAFRGLLGSEAEGRSVWDLIGDRGRSEMAKILSLQVLGSLRRGFIPSAQLGAVTQLKKINGEYVTVGWWRVGQEEGLALMHAMPVS